MCVLTSRAGSEDRGLLFQVHADVSLFTALRESFIPAGRPASHRLAVFDASGEIVAVISQLDVIRYLRQHPELLGDLASTTIGALGWAPPAPPPASPTSASAPAPAPASPGSSPSRAVAFPFAAGGRPLVSVEASLPAVLAYERMARAGVSGAPVTADGEAALAAAGGPPGVGGGGMIANLSMSDLRNIQSQHFGILALPVGEFLALLHNTSYLGYSQRSSQQAGHPFFATAPPTVPPPAGSPLSRHGSAAGAALAGGRRSSTPGGGGGGGARAMEEEGGGGNAAYDDRGIRMITCTRESTFLEVLSLLADNGVHRVYVLAAMGPPPVRPTGVVTPTDILRALAGRGVGPGPGRASRSASASSAAPSPGPGPGQGGPAGFSPAAVP